MIVTQLAAPKLSVSTDRLLVDPVQPATTAGRIGEPIFRFAPLASFPGRASMLIPLPLQHYSGLLRAYARQLIGHFHYQGSEPRLD